MKRKLTIKRDFVKNVYDKSMKQHGIFEGIKKVDGSQQESCYLSIEQHIALQDGVSGSGIPWSPRIRIQNIDNILFWLP